MCAGLSVESCVGPTSPSLRWWLRRLLCAALLSLAYGRTGRGDFRTVVFALARCPRIAARHRFDNGVVSHEYSPVLFVPVRRGSSGSPIRKCPQL